MHVPPHVRWILGRKTVARTIIRATASIGALGLGLLAMSPAVAATDSQAGANAVTISIAGNAQGTGLATATYENGAETKSGNTTPAFPDPTGQKFITGGVLAQEATAKPGFSAACAGLAGDGGSVVNIGDSSCLKPGNLLTGSFGSFDPSTLVPAQLSQADLSQLTDALNQVPGLSGALSGLPALPTGGSNPLTSAISTALTAAQGAVGQGGLVANLDLIDGRCTAGDGRPTGDADLTNADISFVTPAKTFTLTQFDPHPAPNTHVVTNLKDVADAIVNAFKTSLTATLGTGQASGVLQTLQTQVIDPATSQLQTSLAPLQDNLLDITLNQQVHPTADSIKVRALNVDVLPAAKSALNGQPLANLQIGNAACAPVARTAAVSPPQASTPKASNPKTPTAVSSGLASVPGQQHGLDAATWALVALAGLGMAGAGLVGARRIFS